jgi:hypothetical protein
MYIYIFQKRKQPAKELLCPPGYGLQRASKTLGCEPCEAETMSLFQNLNAKYAMVKSWIVECGTVSPIKKNIQNHHELGA